MDLQFLKSAGQIKNEYITYLVQHAENKQIRSDIFKLLASVDDFGLDYKIVDNFIAKVIKLTPDDEIDSLLSVMAVHNIKNETYIFELLEKNHIKTAKFIKNHIVRSSPLVTHIVRYLTERLIRNIIDHSNIISYSSEMEELENTRDIFIELLSVYHTDNTLIDSTFMQLISGYISLKDNCKQQCYLVDLLAKTIYGTHYSIERYTELDRYFLTAITDISEELRLSNFDILRYLHLNTSKTWLELYNSVIHNKDSKKVYDLPDFTVDV